MLRRQTFKVGAAAGAVVCAALLVYPPARDDGELPNRIPEAAPYVVEEARFFPPPFEDYWQKLNHPGQCQSCHQRIFDEWNGSMMSNAWRDPAWRGAFLLSARQTSTDGDCAVPDPPDGTAKARHNPFAHETECTSTFDIGTTRHTLARPGSLVDGFCSRCHMPSNYVDNIPLENVVRDTPSGMEHGRLDSNFNPTGTNGTGLAFATLDPQQRNTETGKSGVFCGVCHTVVETRDTPYHNFKRSESGETPKYLSARGTQSRAALLPAGRRDTFAVPNANESNLGYGIGAGSFRLSPHAIGFPERLGPLASTRVDVEDRYLSQVFQKPMAYESMDTSKHEGFHHVMITRAEYCSACHDVTNPMTIKNHIGKWVGGFPIERTYAEWAESRYADRPGNRNFDASHKRDCQTCHMQQDYGQPGTAQTLYKNGAPLPPVQGAAAINAPERPHFTHHFVGGNSYITDMIGAAVDEIGNVQPYPELSAFSFTSADKKSVYSNAFWTNVGKRGPPVQQTRMAWARLRNVLDLAVTGPRHVADGVSAPLAVSVTNSGSGHKFPTGFPEGRIAWLSVRAHDLATGGELTIHDSFWNRDSLGVGRLTTADMTDPSYPEGCHWKVPAGSPDPYAVQFKAVASLGDGCPTLDLVYAHALNLVTNADGQPVDKDGVVIDRDSPRGLPQFRDVNGDGDLYDDSFLTDTRLRPLPNRGSTQKIDRYSVVVPPGTEGPVAVTAAVYYQSIEAIVAQKFLGNLADTNLNLKLEPCVLGGLCDGRTPSSEPAVVEGSPPVPMEVRNWLIEVSGSRARPGTPAVTTYPPAGAKNVFHDVVVKASFSEPVTGVDDVTFTLTSGRGERIPALVDQIGDGTWALFPKSIFLEPETEYTARLEAGACGLRGNCTSRDVVWAFRTSAQRGEGTGNTTVAMGFASEGSRTGAAPLVRAVQWFSDHRQVVTAQFSEPVMNVTSSTFLLQKDTGRIHDCSSVGAPVRGTLSANAAGDVWTFVPMAAVEPGATYCATLTPRVYDLAGMPLPEVFRVPLAPNRSTTHKRAAAVR